MDHPAPKLASPRKHTLPRVLGLLVESQELFVRGHGATHRVEQPQAEAAASTWFGVGISNHHPSRGLPVDVLVMVFAQEMIRRALGQGHSRILVADTNALRSGIDELAVRRVAGAVQRTLESVTRDLGFPTRVFKASTHPQAEAIGALADRLEASNPYAAEQMAQTELMRREGSTIKVGWRLSRSAFDESSFDAEFDRNFAQGPMYLYTIGGRSLDPRRPRACPYLCADPDRRILLQRGENVRAKLRDDGATERGYRRLLAKLARAHERLVGGLDPKRPEDTVQAIIDRLPEVGARWRG
jgi:hypothetical protein